MTLHKADDNQPNGTVFIRVNKQREDEKPAPMAFQIKGFEIGQNRHGETSTVPWAVPFTPTSSLLQKSSAKAFNKPTQSLSNLRAKDLLRVLVELHRQDSMKWHKPKDLGEMSGEPFNSIRGNADTMRKKVRAGLDMLGDNNEIEESDDGVRFLSIERHSLAQEPVKLKN
jgi:hypothetical protein